MKIKPTFFGFILAVFVSVLVLPAAYAQFEIPEKPSFQTSVYDYANLLSATEKSSLEQKLIQYSDSTTTQIVVVTVETLNGEYIGQLATKWAHTWGVGQAKEDNGVFILLAKNERKIWIAPGYGVEDRLTAGINGELIRNVIIPEFKAGSYYNGLDKGTDAIFEVLKGKYKGTRKKDGDTIDLGGILIFIFIIVLLLIIFSKNNRNGGGGRRSGTSLSDIIILSSLGRGSGGWSSGGSSWGGGSSGGGFGGGFGGGGFSGGGAGGDW